MDHLYLGLGFEKQWHEWSWEKNCLKLLYTSWPSVGLVKTGCCIQHGLHQYWEKCTLDLWEEEKRIKNDKIKLHILPGLNSQTRLITWTAIFWRTEPEWDLTCKHAFVFWISFPPPNTDELNSISIRRRALRHEKPSTWHEKGGIMNEKL